MRLRFTVKVLCVCGVCGLLAAGCHKNAEQEDPDASVVTIEKGVVDPVFSSTSDPYILMKDTTWRTGRMAGSTEGDGNVPDSEGKTTE